MVDQESDYALYGKSFQELEEKEGVSRRPLSIENQIVTDEKGRRRFHGAFTGGFSAGYFNTVGTIEGWAPSTFVSGRTQRAQKVTARPEDYMDSEDLGEHGIAPKCIKTTKDFRDDYTVELSQQKRQNLAWEHAELMPEAERLKSLLKPVNNSIGAKLMLKMGWRPGRGIGPKIVKKSVDKEMYPDNFLFTPDDIEMTEFPLKNDVHGLGYKDLTSVAAIMNQNLKKELDLRTRRNQKKGIQGQAFGVGIFEEDDDDVYGTDALNKYDFSLGNGSSDFGENKADAAEIDFVPAVRLLPPRKFFPPPKLDRQYVPKCPLTSKKSSVDKSATSHKHPLSRAFALDEAHSIWSMVSEKDKRKIEEIKSGKVFGTAIIPSKVQRKEENKSVFEDPDLNRRYEMFVACLQRGVEMPKPSELTEWEWEDERKIFIEKLPDKLKALLPEAISSSKPLCPVDIMLPAMKMIKSKFISPQLDDKDTKGQIDQDKLKAVQLKLFGVLTREKHEWHPEKNLCKRFNVPNPYPDSYVTGVPHFKKQGKDSKCQLFGDHFSTTADELDRFPNKKSISSDHKRRRKSPERAPSAVLNKPSSEADTLIVEKFKAAEPSPRPPMDLFQAIFAGESDSSDDDDQKPEVSKPASICSQQELSMTSIERFQPFETRTDMELEVHKINPVREKSVEVVESIRESEIEFYGPSIPPDLSSAGSVNIRCSRSSSTSSIEHSKRDRSQHNGRCHKRKHKKRDKHSKKHKKYRS